MSKALFIAAIMAVAIAGAAFTTDVVDRSWEFTEAGNTLGWTTSSYFNPKGVEAGFWWGETTGLNPYLMSPDNIGVAASANHYLSIKMRMRYKSSPTDRFGPTNAEIWWVTTSETMLTEDKKVTTKVYGNGAWKTYNIQVGNQVKWTSAIKRLKIKPCSATDIRVEIAWVKIVQDVTPPEFVAEHRWTYADGQVTNDGTPTISLMDCFDQISGIERVEFYHRPGASTSEDDWTLDGTDADASDGYQHTYSTLTDGVYDLGVKAYDKSGNAGSWADGDDRWIDDLRIDSSLSTRIEVNASNVFAAVPKEIPGNNAIWYQWGNKYDPATRQLNSSLETRINDMGVPVLRYPGGCFSDTFYWKKSVGPVASRVDQYTNGCNTTLTNKGPAKFGLDEFLRYCEEHDIEPMFTCRFRWPGAPGCPSLDGPDPYAEALADAIDLVEYCNSPNDGSNPNGGTDWAAQRAANGHPEPYGVSYFEIGNEPWGPDPFGSPGNVGFDGPTEYSLAFLKYLEGMTAVDPSIKVSATTHLQGQLDFDPLSPAWTFSVYEQVGDYIGYAQAHPYLPYSAWQTDMTKLYLETMATPKALDDLLSTQRTTIKLTNPTRAGQIKIRLTEWNINYNWWYDPSQGRVNTYHTKTLKAAIALADAFRVFMENRDLVESAEWWHLYEGTWACIASDDTTLHPAYHTFRIFNRHFGDNLVESRVIGSPTFDYVKTPGSILSSQYDQPQLTCVASKSADGKSLYLVVVNKDRDNTRSAEVDIAGFLPSPAGQVSAETWEVNGPNVDDYNNPSSVTTTITNTIRDQSFTYAFPAHSITSFKFTEAPLQADRLSALKALPQETLVSIADRIVIAVFPPDALYIEEVDRSAGIRVEGTLPAVSEGNSVDVTGRIAFNLDGEQCIAAESIFADTSAMDPIKPVSTNTRSIGDTTVDLSNVGLLLTTWGKVTSIGNGCFFISDGGPPDQSLRVESECPGYVGSFLIATGIGSRVMSGGGSVCVLRPRTPSDLLVLLQ